MLEHIAEWGKSSVKLTSLLPLIPKIKQLFECCDIWHCQIKAPGYELVRAVLSLAPLPFIDHREIRVGWKFGFNFCQKFEPFDFSNSLPKIVDPTGNLEHDASVRGKASRIVAQRHDTIRPRQSLAQPVEHRAVG